ncbi:G antigen 10-like [Sciurus carolinensis]|uniref:G antigen 10-like n=1 Tax=Sciurus carolinensis TaxID=30640 RepID=UPI001FB3085F|nr:G antigen 10-like [Sciurus carolinensis]
MNDQLKSRSESSGRRDESLHLIEPLIDEQCDDDPAQREGPPSEVWEILSDQETEDEGESADPGTDLEDDLQEQAQPKTGDKEGDDLAAKMEFTSNLEHTLNCQKQIKSGKMFK